MIQNENKKIKFEFSACLTRLISTRVHQIYIKFKNKIDNDLY